MLHRTIASDPRMFALLWYESRNPVQTIPSMASLIHAIRVLNSDHVDPIEIGRQSGGRLVRMMDRCLDVHQQHPERFLDLRYEDLITDPMSQVRRIYDFIERFIGGSN